MTSTRHVVLIVEDEPVLRIMAADMVEEAGFEVVEAADATQAMRILESRSDVNIVFTDVAMPRGMDGVVLASVIHDRWPQIEIIVTSGYVAAADVILPAGSVFFSKPYPHDKIVAAMQQMAA